jgi:activator of HSP90 ATPase
LKAKIIKQSIEFAASPHDVYEALMDSSKHAEFTGAGARISRKVGGKFSTYDGYSAGTNLELIPDEKIVQSWRASDWPKGHYSKVTFELTKTKTGTKLTFMQTEIPEEYYDDIAQGWLDFYWTPLKEMLEK